jgi:lysophospholipase L1-like esterase
MDSLKLLFLGDSYTIGEGLDREHRWPEKWVRILKEKHVAIDEHTIVAKTGWTTNDLLKRLKESPLASPQFDLVTLLIGVNNQYQGLSMTDYEREYRELIEYCLLKTDQNSDRVLAISIPDWGVSPFGQQRDPAKVALEIDAFNKAACRICYKLGIRFVDITSISRNLGSHTEHYAADELHPSGSQVDLWLKHILDRLSPALLDMVDAALD